jgi:hypothetical protein
MKKLVLFLAMFGLLSILSTNNAQAADNIFKTVKEVFLKGSIDGKNLFMVYGMKDMAKDMKESMSDAVRMKDIVKMGEYFWDKHHDDDFVGAAKDGAEMTKEVAEHLPTAVAGIAKYPWKSLKKIPGSYKISFDNARDSYYNSNNKIAGTLKYAGHAVWANVKGAYYLVVEVPAKIAVGVLETAFTAIGTIAAVPAAIAFQGIKIGYKLVTMTVRLGAKLVANVARFTYALISSTVATTATLVTGTAMLVYKAGKWLIVGIPRAITRPVRVDRKTRVHLDDQEEYAKRVEEVLKDSATKIDVEKVNGNIGKYTSRFVIKMKNAKNKMINAVIVKLGIKDKKVEVEVSATRKYLRALKKLPENAGKKAKRIKSELKRELRGLARSVVNA